jgi:mycothiol synthase
MAHSDEPRPPEAAGLSWRPLRDSDLAEIAQLMGACLAVDGGLPLAAEGASIRERFLPSEGETRSIATFDEKQRLTAFASVRREDRPGASVVSSAGLVRPDRRGMGLGTFLLEWGKAQAQRLLSDAPADRPRVWEHSSESLNPFAERLFATFGLQKRFVEAVMRFEFPRTLPAVSLPAGIVLRMWTPALADRFFAAYAASFADRPGFPGWDEETWVRWATGDDDFAPDASFVALVQGQPIGFIVCARDWITQVGVCPSWRRRGVASGLVNAALAGFRSAGARTVLLDVNTNNPAAMALYERLGFQRIGERGRFSRTLLEEQKGGRE